MKRLLLFGSFTLVFAVAGASALLKGNNLIVFGIVFFVLAFGFVALTIREALTLKAKEGTENRISGVGIIFAILSILCLIAASVITILDHGIVSAIGWIIATCCGIAYVVYVISRNGKTRE